MWRAGCRKRMQSRTHCELRTSTVPSRWSARRSGWNSCWRQAYRSGWAIASLCRIPQLLRSCQLTTFERSIKEITKEMHLKNSDAFKFKYEYLHQLGTRSPATRSGDGGESTRPKYAHRYRSGLPLLLDTRTYAPLWVGWICSTRWVRRVGSVGRLMNRKV